MGNEFSIVVGNVYDDKLPAEYEPTNEELSAWAKSYLRRELSCEITDDMSLNERINRRSLNLGVDLAVEKLFLQFDWNGELSAWLADTPDKKIQKDLFEHFRPKFEELARQREDEEYGERLWDLENDEWNRAVRDGLKG